MTESTTSRKTKPKPKKVKAVVVAGLTVVNDKGALPVGRYEPGDEVSLPKDHWLFARGAVKEK